MCDDKVVGAVYLKSVLTGIARAAHDNGLATGVYGLGCIERQLSACQSQYFLNNLLCLGTLNGQLAVIVRTVVYGYVEALGILHHPLHVLVDVCGVDDDEELVVTHLVHQ